MRRPVVVLLAGTLTGLAASAGLYLQLRHDLSTLVPVTYSVAPTSAVTWPAANTFAQHWNSGMKRGRSAVFWGRGRFCEADHVYYPVGDQRDRVIEVLIPRPGSPADAPAMQIRLAYIYRDSRGGVFPYPGDPYVIANLDAPQAQYVWTNDIPQGLIGAMIKAADEAGWVPLDPAKGVPGKPLVDVDPAPHFPDG